MENINNEFNLEEELREIKSRREKEEQEKSIELHEYLDHLTLVRRAKEGVAIGLAAAVMLGGYFMLKSKGEKEPTPTPISEYTVTLVRNYTIEYGDTLSQLSSDTGISVDKIARDNDISNPNMIGMNHHLQLNYDIPISDLSYYTETINVGGLTIGEIANTYNTNVSTLINLNHEAIVMNDDNTYTILSDTLTVPKFITAGELSQLHASQK